MPLKYITGGKSYPDQIAFQRGPQILALDKSLNSGNVNDLVSDTKEGIVIGKFNQVNEKKILPVNWIGKQAYSLNIINGKEKIFLVPFAEASQTEGDMKVWLPVKLEK